MEFLKPFERIAKAPKSQLPETLSAERCETLIRSGIDACREMLVFALDPKERGVIERTQETLLKTKENLKKVQEDLHKRSGAVSTLTPENEQSTLNAYAAERNSARAGYMRVAKEQKLPEYIHKATHNMALLFAQVHVEASRLKSMHEEVNKADEKDTAVIDIDMPMPNDTGATGVGTSGGDEFIISEPADDEYILSDDPNLMPPASKKKTA